VRLLARRQGTGLAAEGGMGSELSDADLCRERSLQGGLAFDPASLRRMRRQPPDTPHFGEPFLWTALFRRTAGG
jgi:hypothetical protein